MYRKKICFVTTTSLTIKTFLLGQLIFLSKNGYEVTVICNHDIKLKQLLPKDINYKPITMKRGIKPLNTIKSIYQIYKILRVGKYDIVQYSTPNAALYSAIASWVAKIPIRLYCQWGIRYVGFTGWKRGLFKVIEKLVCSLSTNIEPDSNGNLEFSHREGLYNKDKSKVIWNGSANGVELEKFVFSKKEIWRSRIRDKYDIDFRDIVLGFIGRLDKDKGVNELLGAFKIILSKYPMTKLLMIGSDDKNEGLDQELLQWSRSTDAIKYTGFTNEVEKYIAALDIFILPSYREGFGSVVIEAEAMGVPVIVTDIPGPIDAMKPGETGLTVPKATVQPLVEAIEQMIVNPKMREKMGENAKSFARTNFDQSKLWDFIMEDRERLYNTFVSSKKEKMNA
ncbi:glycosyltransferase involved in cell wall biosynthesis [Evansella vedderi]|uniref:Glycosyltransferase involved in cell wall biosynthesis n=1 Tax=Evansella vedderi TaxID=38282 RepID=A0ABU0A0D6_9BACI|nr:glycosyltransferase family 4 protein [Evansella vedderi]MDQ0256584.1 glycosyltransferase involved in cell wall biosynthesis [Evansella vedderi]